MAVTPVQGNCPMGCGETLKLDKDGQVVCRKRACPNPGAVHWLLQEDGAHRVRLDEGSFEIRHPLRERLNGELWDCSLHHWLIAQPGPPYATGTYRVVGAEDAYLWEPHADAE